jgi:hypothetical protein
MHSIASKSTSPAAIIFVPLVTAVFSIIFGVAYAYASWHNPFIYIGFLLPYLWAFAVRWTAGWVFNAFPVRNVALALFLGILGAIPGYVVESATWLALFINQTDDPLSIGSGAKGLIIAYSTVSFAEVWDIIINYKDTFPILMEILDEGVWSLGSFLVKGIIYKAIWVAELLFFLFLLSKHYYKLVETRLLADGVYS